MNLLDILTTSPHYFYRKCVGATNENFNVHLSALFLFLFSILMKTGPLNGS